MLKQDKQAWNPYVAGALNGLLIILSVWTVGKYFGASTSFVRAAGMIEKLFSPERVSQMAYFISKTPKIDWQWMFVVGILLGSLVSSVTSGTFKWQAVPVMWQQKFGTDLLQRGVFAFIGGIIAMFGARLAGGCPSGHGLSGTLQLSISGYIALACFFGVGVVVARLVYGGGNRQ